MSDVQRRAAATWAKGAEDADRKPSSYVNKFYRFVLSEHGENCNLLPLFPLDILKLSEYVIFCDENGVSGGMKSISNYITHIVQFGLEKFNAPDPRSASPLAEKQWKTFVHNFVATTVPEGNTKLRLQPAMLVAMCLDIDTSKRRDVRDNAQYTNMWYGAWRAGHTSTANRRVPKHLLRWEDVVFLPSVQRCERAFFLLRSTKTRDKSKPWWTAVERLGDDVDARLCPVRSLVLWYRASFRGNPRQAVFTGTVQPLLPLTRTEFANGLRARLVRAQPRLDVDPEIFDVSKWSAISFRKAGLSSLGRTDVGVNRLAEHGDHASMESTRAYTSDTVEERAQNTRAMARQMGIGRGMTLEECREVHVARQEAVAAWRHQRPRETGRERGYGSSRRP